MRYLLLFTQCATWKYASWITALNDVDITKCKFNQFHCVVGEILCCYGNPLDNKWVRDAPKKGDIFQKSAILLPASRK